MLNFLKGFGYTLLLGYLSLATIGTGIQLSQSFLEKKEPEIVSKFDCSSLPDACVKIETEKGEGSGFLVESKDHRTLIFTAAHVAILNAFDEGDGIEYGDLKVVFNDGSEGSAEVTSLSSERDVALLTLVSGHPRSYVHWRDSDLSVGEPVFFCGSSCGKINGLTNGIVSFIGRDAQPHFPKDIDQVSTPTFPGASGGLISDVKGRAVGIVSGGPGETFTLIVPARSVRRWLQGEGMEWAWNAEEK